MEEISLGCHYSRMKRMLDKLVPMEARLDRVGPRISAIRNALEMTKADFADSIRLDRSTLTKVENGQMGLDIAKGLAISSLYEIGLDFIYLGKLSDLPTDLRDKVIHHLPGP